MAFRQVHTSMWRDDWFIDLDPAEKLLFIYLFSNDSSNLLGLYKLSLRVAANETGLDREFIETTLTKFEKDGKVIFRDGYVWVVNLLRHNFNRSDKTIIHVRNEIARVPNIPLKMEYIAHANSVLIPYGYSIDTPSIPHEGVSSGTGTGTGTGTVSVTGAEEEPDTPSIPLDPGTWEPEFATAAPTASTSPTSPAIAAAPAFTQAQTAAMRSEWGDNSARDAEKLYRDVTGQITIPADNRQTVIETLATILDCYKSKPNRKPIDDGKAVFARWCATTGKNGKPYSRTNPGWLSWWLDRLAPEPERPALAITDIPTALCKEGMRLRKSAESSYGYDHEDASIAFRKHVDNCRICSGKEEKTYAPMPDAVKEKLKELTGKLSIGGNNGQ